MSSPGSRRSTSGLMRRGLRKKACRRAPSALSCFMRLSFERRFWNHTCRGEGEREAGGERLPGGGGVGSALEGGGGPEQPGAGGSSGAGEPSGRTGRLD